MARQYRQWHVAAAQVIGQLSLVVVLPILTRLISPSEIGLYQTILALSLVIQPIATLRIEFVIPSLSTEGEYRRVRKIALMTLASTLILITLPALAAYFMGHRHLASQLTMCAVLVLAYGWSVLDNAHTIRRNQRRRLVIRNLLSGLLSALFQLLAAFYFPTALALSLAILLGRACAILLSKIGDNEDHSFESAASETGEWRVGRGLAAVLSGIASSGSAQSLILISGIISGPVASAQVGVARQVSGAPIGLLSQGLSQTAQLTIAPLVQARDQRAYVAVKRQVRHILPFGVLAFIGLVILGPMLAEPILGGHWKQAGSIIALLALPSALQLLFAPLMTVFPMLGEESLQLKLQIWRFIACVATMTGAFIVTEDLLVAIAGHSIAASVWYLVAYRFILRELKRL